MTARPLAAVDEVYPNAPRQTIDVGIMEPAPNVANVQAQFGHADIGSWAELWELSPRTEDGNVVLGSGRVLIADSQNNLVFADGRTVALVGVSDLVVIETADAVFVCPRARAKDVKSIVQQLQSEGHEELL